MRFALLTSFCAVTFCASTAAAAAQTVPDVPVIAMPLAATTVSLSVPASSSSAETALPDSPEVAIADAYTFNGIEGQAGNGHVASTQAIAPKYAGSILPGQGAVPFTAKDKIAFGFRDTVSPYSFLSRVISATWSQALDSQPHYGQGWGPYGQRIGASFARGTVQDLATDAVFCPIFRDDPRYYVLGRQHKFFNRVVYAATRVIITRTDSGHNTVNAPLLLGYAAAAGTNMAYYPQRDRNFHDAATGYAGSLGGGVLGMEVSEFLDDALHLVHIRHN